MSVIFTVTDDISTVAGVAGTVTYLNMSIGAAAPDRIVCLMAGEEFATGVPASATIDFGTGPQAMSASQLANLAAMSARIFYFPAPTGTTATFVVTFSAGTPNGGQNHAFFYAVTGAQLPIGSDGQNTTTDMAGVPLTTGSVTVPTGGGILAVTAHAAGVGSNPATYTNIDVFTDQLVGGGTYRSGIASRTAAGTFTATVAGTISGEDAAMAWIIFNPVSLTTDTIFPFDHIDTGFSRRLENIGY